MPEITDSELEQIVASIPQKQTVSTEAANPDASTDEPKQKTDILSFM